MAHIIRSVVSTAVVGIHRSSYSALRTIFSNSGIGIDNFKLSRELYASRNATSTNTFKARFTDLIHRSDVPIFTEDLRNMILAAETDEDIHGVIQALKKYNTSKLKFTDFHFGSPIMRLLHVQNKSDLAMQLFMDESFQDVFRDASAALVLMNKLIEENRYDDAIKIFEYGIQRGFPATSGGRTYPSDVFMLAIEALYRQNTKQSFAKAKEFLSDIAKYDSDINPRTAAMTALLAIRQGEPSFAIEILGAGRIQNLTTIRNIRAICYADIGRVEEAINIVHLLADQPPIDDDRRRVFPLVLQHIRTAVNKSKDQEIQTRFEDLSNFVSNNNRLSTIDLSDFLNEPINRRTAVTPNRPGLQQHSRGTFQRTGDNSTQAGFRRSHNRQ